MRLGTIKVNDDWHQVEPEILREFYKYLEIIPFRVEHLYAAGVFEVTGESPRFDEIEEGYMAPEYRMEVTINGEGNVFRVEKV